MFESSEWNASDSPNFPYLQIRLRTLILGKVRRIKFFFTVDIRIFLMLSIFHITLIDMQGETKACVFLFNMFRIFMLLNALAQKYKNATLLKNRVPFFRNSNVKFYGVITHTG